MGKLLDEIKVDLKFVGSHTLQPKWYKVLKALLLVAFLAGYWLRYGAGMTLLFVGVFFGLMLLLHLAYRTGTHKYQRTWLDFKVVDVDGVPRAVSIGPWYYVAVACGALLAYALSQRLG